MSEELNMRPAVLSVLALVAGLLATAPAQAQCAMWCPNGSGPAEFVTLQTARTGCHGGEIVWVQDRPRVYHKAGWPKFGKTKRGSFICKASVERAGLRQANLFQRFL